VIGFDKMFNIYMRNIRQQIIPPEDFGKTAGVITLFNNSTQPLAGLLVGLLANYMGTPWIIFALSAAMAAVGALALLLFPSRIAQAQAG
jgi:hypothetical protein